MTQRTNFTIDRTAPTFEELETIRRRAYAVRNAMIGTLVLQCVRAIGDTLRSAALAVRNARRLQALAALSAGQLTALGVARGDLPAIVYGWKLETIKTALPVPPTNGEAANSNTSEQEAA